MRVLTANRDPSGIDSAGGCLLWWNCQSNRFFKFVGNEQIPEWEQLKEILSNESIAPEENKDSKPKEEHDEDIKHNRREELMSMLLETIKNSENFPAHVRYSFITHLDLEGALTLIYSILKEQEG